MTVGGEQLLNKYGSVLGVAIAYLKGDIDLYQEHVRYVCSSIDILAAESVLRLDAQQREWA